MLSFWNAYHQAVCSIVETPKFQRATSQIIEQTRGRFFTKRLGHVLSSDELLHYYYYYYYE